MGKALIFSGVTVDSPLQTVTILKELVTADDYINEYAKLATGVTSVQKNYLKTFINTLMINELWDKVKCCFPMLGGLGGYNKDLKDIFNQRTWNTPTEGTTWDEVRNAPYLSLPGNAKGTPLVIENIYADNSTFLFSTKFAKRLDGFIITPMYKDGTLEGVSNLGTLFASEDNYGCPSWDTTRLKENVEGYIKNKNANNIYMLSRRNGTNSLFFCSNNNSLISARTSVTPSVADTDKVSLSFGGYLLIETSAPATYTLNGTMNMFIAFNSALTEEELQVVSKAVWDFDEACGRHIDFEE